MPHASVPLPPALDWPAARLIADPDWDWSKLARLLAAYEAGAVKGWREARAMRGEE